MTREATSVWILGKPPGGHVALLGQLPDTESDIAPHRTRVGPPPKVSPFNFDRSRHFALVPPLAREPMCIDITVGQYRQAFQVLWIGRHLVDALGPLINLGQ